MVARKIDMRALMEAIEIAGGVRALARSLGITHQAIKRWHKVPADRLVDIERVTGVDRRKLRPDLYQGMRERA